MIIGKVPIIHLFKAEQSLGNTVFAPRFIMKEVEFHNIVSLL